MAAEATTSAERTWGTVAHAGAAIVNFAPPVLVLLTKGPTSAFVRAQAVEAINFQITVVIAYAAATVLAFVVHGYFLLLFPVIFFANIIMCVTAAMAARNGRAYAYPVSARPLK